MTIDGEMSAFPLAPTMDLSSAQAFHNSQSLNVVHNNKYEANRYGRDSHPTAQALERALEGYHDGYKAVTFRSGMAAIEAVMNWAWGRFDNFYVQSEIYRKSELVIQNLDSLSSRSITRLGTNSKKPESTSNPDSTDFYFFEFPSNPHLRILEDWKTTTTDDAKDFVFVDATLSGLGNLSQNFLDTVDVICYSLTKYIGGHNDLIGGVLFVKPELYEVLWEVRSRMGNILGPAEAHLCLRSLKTFAIRFHNQSENALSVLNGLTGLKDQGALSEIFFPGQGENLFQEILVNETINVGGSVVSFVVPGERRELAQKMQGFKSIKMAPSFGSTDSLIEICSLMSRPDLSDLELAQIGLEPCLVRLSVGLEDAHAIIKDIVKLL